MTKSPARQSWFFCAFFSLFSSLRLHSQGRKFFQLTLNIFDELVRSSLRYCFWKCRVLGQICVFPKFLYYPDTLTKLKYQNDRLTNRTNFSSDTFFLWKGKASLSNDITFPSNILLAQIFASHQRLSFGNNLDIESSRAQLDIDGSRLSFRELDVFRESEFCRECSLVKHRNLAAPTDFRFESSMSWKGKGLPLCFHPKTTPQKGKPFEKLRQNFLTCQKL